MNALKVATDVTLWAGWIGSAATVNLPMLGVVCLAAVTVGVARQDWDNGVRPFTSVK